MFIKFPMDTKLGGACNTMNSVSTHIIVAMNCSVHLTGAGPMSRSVHFITPQ